MRFPRPLHLASSPECRVCCIGEPVVFAPLDRRFMSAKPPACNELLPIFRPAVPEWHRLPVCEPPQFRHVVQDTRRSSRRNRKTYLAV